MYFTTIGNNLIIRKGRIVCKDGQPLMQYLKAAGGHRNGDEINIVHHSDLVKMNEQYGFRNVVG